ncbi:MAG: hypothetical protein WBO55_02850 [Rhizobiaceae bacterium]
MLKLLSVATLGAFCVASAVDAHAADPLDPTPVAYQGGAVDGINFKASAITGVIGGYTNHMFLASVATPLPYLDQFGAQLDFGIGNYRSDYISAAAGLHLFWRDPSVGLVGIYGDWGYVNPEHAGRVGLEASMYNGNWTLEGVAGVTFGQHVLTQFFDEVDLAYYFTDNFRASIGHRLTTRGNVGNISFEYMPELGAGNGWSIYGEAEAGEDDYSGAWIGLRYSFGTSSASTLKARDRTADPTVRIPRNLASVTRCGDIQDPANYHQSWNGFETHRTKNLCGSADDLADYGAIEGKL